MHSTLIQLAGLVIAAVALWLITPLLIVATVGLVIFAIGVYQERKDLLTPKTTEETS